ncbi:unnamed protein product [Bursaphelenchus xylophilus]|uniref:(pine wood nematode) hypothetical protein n=1 Tax=Bursaphelenchus xylophilus TaxID=6326 RepID=A0A1I7RHP6_BURXY|nr:unnamed protein product [Bursaphelenchus xylophilus]CAG9115520.1 unnamed protein product [Bursaphelenchus xylophilus]
MFSPFPWLLWEFLSYGALMSTICVCCNNANKAGKNKQTLSKSKSGDSVGNKKSEQKKERVKASPVQQPDPEKGANLPHKGGDGISKQPKDTKEKLNKAKKKELSKQEKTKQEKSGDTKSNNEKKGSPKEETKKDSLSEGEDVVIKEDKVKKMGLLDEEVRNRQQKDLKEIQEMGSEHELDKRPPSEPIAGKKVAIKEEHCKLYETEHEGTLDE